MHFRKALGIAASRFGLSRHLDLRLAPVALLIVLGAGLMAASPGNAALYAVGAGVWLYGVGAGIWEMVRVSRRGRAG